MDDMNRSERTFILSFEGFHPYYLADSHEIVSILELEPASTATQRTSGRPASTDSQ